MNLFNRVTLSVIHYIHENIFRWISSLIASESSLLNISTVVVVGIILIMQKLIRANIVMRVNEEP